MSAVDTLLMLLAGAIWGASFLFLRIAAPEFGPVPLIAVRVAVAALFLGAIVALTGSAGALRGRGGRLLVLGALNTAVPFSLFAFAALALPAGTTSVLNATVPLFGALLVLVRRTERLGLQRLAGLAIGFTGVCIVVWPKLALHGGALAILAGLSASAMYAISTLFIKARLADVPPLALAAGSQLGAAVLLLPVAAWRWPAVTPSPTSWACGVALGVLCTGIAYLTFFRLLASVGPVRALLVTYLIPVFGVTWGALFLHEKVTLYTVVGTAVILGGVALSTAGSPLVPRRKSMQTIPTGHPDAPPSS